MNFGHSNDSQTIAYRFLRSIAQKAGEQLEDDEMILSRLVDAYWELCRETCATWKKSTVATLTAVTATTNQHALATALGLATGYEVFDTKQIFWKSSPRQLRRLNKDVIDYYNNTYASSGTPDAYAFWEEGSVSYISFFPYISSDDSTNMNISYFEKPPVPDVVSGGGTSAWDQMSPVFDSKYHHLIAEKAALQYLRDHGSRKYNLDRRRDVENLIGDMTDFYIGQMEAGMVMGSPVIGGGGWGRIHFYGE